MVKNLPSNAGGAGSIPGWGTQIPQLEKSKHPRACALQLEKALAFFIMMNNQHSEGKKPEGYQSETQGQGSGDGAGRGGRGVTVPGGVKNRLKGTRRREKKWNTLPEEAKVVL